MQNIFLWSEYLPTVTFQFMVKLAVAAMIMLLSRLIIKAIQPIIEDLCTKSNLESHSCHVLHKIVRYVITIISATIALQNLGVEVTMLITAFGVTGVVLSYGMKDIVANFIASILILGYKQFKINDYIKVSDFEGKVVDINLRYTTIENNNTTIFIPNIVLYTNPIAVIKE